MKGPYSAVRLVSRPSERTVKGVFTFGGFIFLWVWLEKDKDRRERLAAEHYEPPVPSFTLGQLAWAEGIKLATALTWCLWRRRSKHHQPDYGRESLELRDGNEARLLFDARGDTGMEDGASQSLPIHNNVPSHHPLSVKDYLSVILSLSFLHVCYSQHISIAGIFLDPIALSLIVAALPLLSLVLLRSLWSKSFTSVDWLSALLQICGFVIIKNILLPNFDTSRHYSIIPSYALHQAITLVLTDWVFKSYDRSLLAINTGFFGTSLFMTLVVIALSRDSGLPSPSAYMDRNILYSAHQKLRSSPLPELLRPIFKAGVDLSELCILYEWGVLALSVFTVMRSLAYISGYMLYAGLLLSQPGILFACAVAAFGCWALMEREKTVPENDRPSSTYGPILGRISPPLFLPVFSFVVTLALIIRSPFPSVHFRPDQQAPLALSSLMAEFQRPKCARMPLPVPPLPCAHCPGSGHGGPAKKRLHAFDDVLLVVFFSHARYDVNLDYYRDVYGEWFPNILFVGPKSREDKGFKHSYDVVVDSYMSDEDLSDPKHYKMAGRMAHHMLYTALTQHPCYKGYLWAPFDALLNVPRLTLFDQERFWYHSFAGEYVWNPALTGPPPNVTTTTPGSEERQERHGVSAGERIPNVRVQEDPPVRNDSAPVMDGNYDQNRHATPVVVGPDPEVDWTVGWRGWGPDWWWGDPRVGLKACYPAFLRTPEHMRSRMSRLFTNGTTRLIGGSADTLYIPGQYREVFIETLGLFLETECFLEIAVPTAVHLVVGELGEFDRKEELEDPVEIMKGKGIQFVDHWWIWYPPFNATFVRQKWAEGYEVDTMHTFHWGDADEDGEWRGRPEHIYDLRMLMKESAQRQGIPWL